MAIMDLFNKNKGNNNASAAIALQIANMKKGKTPDQCKCIDFFYLPDEPKKKGCLKSMKKEWAFEEYTTHVQSIVNSLNLKARAIAKIGLDESQISEIPPIVLASFSRSKDGVVKYNDNYTKYVTNKYSVTWIFFSATQLYTYQYTFDTTSDDTVETTRDFFYSDITCIRTEHEVEEAIYEENNGCGCLKKTESRYVHRNRHWDTLQITVPNDSYAFCCRTTDTIEQSIQAAKAMIREKKQA